MYGVALRTVLIHARVQIYVGLRSTYGLGLSMVVGLPLFYSILFYLMQ